MIRITKHNSTVAIKGHADHAPLGQDIVCAAVSTAFQSLVSSVEELTDDRISYKLKPGNSHIRFESLSEETDLLLRSFFITVNDIAEAYPECVAVIEYDSTGTGGERAGAERKNSV